MALWLEPAVKSHLVFTQQPFSPLSMVFNEIIINVILIPQSKLNALTL